jgi:predicted exporter
LPVLAKRNGVLLALVALTLLSGPFMLINNWITKGDSWLTPASLSAAALVIVGLWLMYAVLRSARVNIWGKCALVVLISGLTGQSTNLLLGGNTPKLSLVVNTVVIGVAALTIGAIGYIMESRKPKGKK